MIQGPNIQKYDHNNNLRFHRRNVPYIMDGLLSQFAHSSMLFLSRPLVFFIISSCVLIILISFQVLQDHFRLEQDDLLAPIETDMALDFQTRFDNNAGQSPEDWLRDEVYLIKTGRISCVHINTCIIAYIFTI